ncbi:MAG: ABC transporter permease [Aeromicrobium sp.]|nr:MAG: ABC transporter permease [Aeromicrobium sp.]
MPETPRPGQERFVASIEETPLRDIDVVDTTAAPESQWAEAWKRLRGRGLFWVSAVLLLGVIVMIAVPGLFTSKDPTMCDITLSLAGPAEGSPLGYNLQGCDVWSRTVYGARASVSVGIFTVLIVATIGSITGAVAGFYGGWIDSVVSRISDIFFSIPLLLAAIVMLSVVNNLFPERTFWTGVASVVLALSLFAWPQITRQMRGAVLSVKNLEFVDAAKAIGASNRRNLIKHVVPNSMAPVIVTSMISLGVFIVAEATLSFLGIGLPRQEVVSWGNDIADAQVLVRSGENLDVMFIPATALALTVLAFILLGDAVRDALDPKAKK